MVRVNLLIKTLDAREVNGSAFYNAIKRDMIDDDPPAKINDARAFLFLSSH